MLWGLFIAFLKIGFLSFGGGYAMIPVIQHEVTNHSWMSNEGFADAVALAGMAPGPIATNTATIIGYKSAGIPGAIVSTAGMVLPSLILIILLAAFFYRIHGHKWVKASFYGLKPIVAGLIIYAAIHFGFSGNNEDVLSWHMIATLFLVAGALVAIIRYKLHPLVVIVLSGLMGIAFF
jgi:chromate transporter